MLSRRDFLSGQFRSQGGEEHLQSIAPDFSEEMLCREMMRMGRDPSNMNREQMLHMVLKEMRAQ